MQILETVKEAAVFVGDVIKWAVVGSVGWIIYGIPKTIVEFKRRHDWSVKLAEVTETIQELQQKLIQAPGEAQSPQLIKATEGIGLEGRKNVEKTEGTQVMQQELLSRLKLLRKHYQAEYDNHDREFQHGAIATIPIVGAFLANQFMEHSGIISGLTYDIAKEVSSKDRVFFMGGEPHLSLPGQEFRSIIERITDEKSLSGKEVKALWDKAGGIREFIPVRYLDETGQWATRKIESMFLPGNPANGCKGPTDKTVIVSHGTASTLYSTYYISKVYQEMGYNVLAYTIGGKQYKQMDPPADGNNDKIVGNELTAAQDVDGVMEALKVKGIKQVTWHGHSLGGLSMSIGAEKYGKGCPRRGVEDYPEVERIIVDQTFTDGESTAANFANNFLGFEWRDVGSGLGTAAAPIGRTDGIHTTTGINNLARLEKLKNSAVEVYAFASPQDHLMGYDWNTRHLQYDSNFPIDLFNARYPDPHARPNHQLHILPQYAPHGYIVSKEIPQLVPARNNLPS